MKKYYLIFLGILLIEFSSLIAFHWSFFRKPFFIVLALLFAYTSFRFPRYALYIALSELVIGSKSGNLFFWDISGFRFSLRMLLWSILLAHWLINFIHEKSWKHYFNLSARLKKLVIYFSLLFVFIFWGVLVAFGNDYALIRIFSDANAYLYFLLLFPILDYIRKYRENDASDFFAFISLTGLWAALKTLIILFLFSHQLEGLNSLLYSWIRTSGVGEITQMEGGFYRVFFQSHIYIIALSISVFLLLMQKIKRCNYERSLILRNKEIFLYLLILIIFFAANIVSMSRSNWVGLIVAAFFIFAYSFYGARLRGFLVSLVSVLLITAISFALILFLVKFPYPRPIGGFAAGDIFAERASELTDEAGVSSRWNLLPVLLDKIKEAPLIGSGFGASVSYISDDPRVREKNPDGKYTTSAFEWGWLDIWIKLGLFGFLAYLFLVFGLIQEAWKSNKYISGPDQALMVSLAIILLSVSAINFFSPYLNHPLGIGLLLMVFFLLAKAPEGELE